MLVWRSQIHGIPDSKTPLLKEVVNPHVAFQSLPVMHDMANLRYFVDVRIIVSGVWCNLHSVLCPPLKSAFALTAPLVSL